MAKAKKSNSGFTLVEVLVAVAVMAIITILAFPSIRQFQATNAKKKFETYGMTMKDAAKLYVDSQGRDLFGYNFNGCADILLKELIDSSLMKEYEEKGVSCLNDESFVHVTKKGDKYTYSVHLLCTKDESVYYETKEAITKCDESERNGGPVVSFDGINNTYTKSRTVTVTVSAEVGLHENIRLTYCFKKKNSDDCVGDMQNQAFTNSRGEASVSFEATTPAGLSGTYYLFVGTNMIRDAANNTMSSDAKSQDVYLDNEPPVFDKLTNPSNGEWTKNDFALTMEAHDDLSGIGYYQYRYPTSTNENDKAWVNYSNSDKNKYVTPKFTSDKNMLLEARVCDKAGNCSDPKSTNIKLDKTKPKCVITKSNTGTTGGINAVGSCSDDGSGCVSSDVTYTDITSNVSYTVSDKVGNTNKCTVKVETYQCNGRSYICGSYACGSYQCGSYPCGSYQCGMITGCDWSPGFCIWTAEPRYCTSYCPNYCTRYCDSYCTDYDTCYR